MGGVGGSTRGHVRWTSVAVVGTWFASVVFTGTLWAVAPHLAKPPSLAVAVVIVALVPLALGGVVARHAPGNAVGPLLALAGFLALATNLIDGDQLGPFGGTWTLLYLALGILLLVVPDGHTASRRWTVLGWSFVAVVAGCIAVLALSWARLGPLPVITAASYALLVAFLLLLAGCALAPFLRHRHADPDQRLRLRWTLLAGTSLPFTLLLCWASYLIVGTADLVGFGLVVMYLAIPIGATIAVVRPALVDIDRATVTTATASVLAMGALILLSVTCGVAGLTLAQWSPIAAIATIALLTGTAAILVPVLQRRLDRLLYPERGRALTAIDQLTTQVELGITQPSAVQDVLRTALRDPGLLVAYRDITDHRLHLLDGSPTTPGATTALVSVRGEEIGALIGSTVRRPSVTVTRAAAPLIDLVRTGAAIAQARLEVEASRERLLRAGYAERRRLERDLHDGAQQRLVALGIRLRVLQRSRPSAEESRLALDAAVAELGTAVAELRRIAHGLRPSTLDGGLAVALADLTLADPDTIHLEVQAFDLPDAVATTAYYVASEAVANALRHARATTIRLSAHERSGVLQLRVADNGIGGACFVPTGGLTGLGDRVAAVGGELRIDSQPGEGTVVEAALPCGS
ncbi:MAG: sensor histidine kinase [Propionibacteriales bacterium]|nr:sensor histidine kinase [Propionibacteriales bacterium]